MDILDFYKGMLASAGIAVDDRGYTTNVTAGVSQPITISGKRLVLPTKEILSAGAWDDIVAFHPASESVIRGESPVLRKLRMGFQNRINYIVMSMLEASIKLVANTEFHSRFSPAQSELLRVLSTVDGEKTIKAAIDVVNAVALDSPNDKFVNLYIKKEGIVNDQTFRRACIVTFPFYQCKEDNKPTIFGKELSRQKDKKSIIAFIEHLLPKSTVVGAYDAGSADLNTPSLCCLLEAVGNIFVQLNNFVLLYADILPLAGDAFADVDQFITDLYWYDGIDHITKYRALIPALDGNQGVASKVEDVSARDRTAQYTLKDRDSEIPKADTGSHTAAAVVHPSQNKAPDTNVRQLSFDEYLRRKTGNVPPPPEYHPGYPVGNYPPPGYPQTAYQTPPPGYPGYPPPAYPPQTAYHPGIATGYPPPPSNYPPYNAGATGLSPGRAAALAESYQRQQAYYPQSAPVHYSNHAVAPVYPQHQSPTTGIYYRS